MANMVKLLEHQLYLLGELSCCWARSKFDCLYKCAFELFVQIVCSLNLKDIVSKGYQIGDCLHLELLSALHERSDLPLLILSRQLLLKPGPGRYDLDILPEHLGCEWHESLCAELDPSFGCIGND